MTTKYLIYGLIDPRNGYLRYVGKSATGMVRTRHHGLPCFLKRDKGHKGAWIRQLQKEGLTYEVLVIEEFDSEAPLAEAEMWNIAYFKSLGCDLVNLTAGGEGASGYRHTAECKLRMSALSKGRPSGMKGKKHSEASKLKTSLSKIGTVSKFKGVPASLKDVLTNSRSHGGKPFTDQFGTIYNTQSEAAKKCGMAQARVWAVLSGKQPETKGFKFRYLE